MRLITKASIFKFKGALLLNKKSCKWSLKINFLTDTLKHRQGCSTLRLPIPSKTIISCSSFTSRTSLSKDPSMDRRKWATRKCKNWSGSLVCFSISTRWACFRYQRLKDCGLSCISPSQTSAESSCIFTLNICSRLLLSNQQGRQRWKNNMWASTLKSTSRKTGGRTIKSSWGAFEYLNERSRRKQSKIILKHVRTLSH